LFRIISQKIIMPSSPQTQNSKYLILAEQLREQIVQRVFKPGDKLPTFVEMRRAHGVTITTVERAYALLEKENLVVREQGRGTFVKAHEERAVRNVIGISGLLLPLHPYSMQLMNGFQQVANEADVELLLLNENNDIQWEKVDGVVSCDTGFVKHKKWQLLPPGMPCVTALIEARDFVSVVGNEYQGAYDLVQHLVSLGHRRIASLYDPYLSVRLDGYGDALRDAGITAEPTWKRDIACIMAPDFQYTSAAHQVVQRWLEEDWRETGCTAIVVQNDDAAMGAIRAFSEAGWKIPQQVSVAGFDGTAVGRYFQPQITSVEVPLREIGATAMEQLLRQVNGEEMRPSTIVLRTQVLEGGTTGKPPSE
jgi:DNA-binding LacI/PurR family transcriptional regulator